MRAHSRALLALGAAIGLAGCSVAEETGKPQPAEKRAAPKPVAAAPAVKPMSEAGGRLDEIEDSTPAEKSKPGDVTRSWFSGNWTDSGDCADAGRFAPNGTYVLADGTRGMWNVQNGRLVVQREEGRSALKLRRVDDATVEVINEDGSVGRSTRCG